MMLRHLAKFYQLCLMHALNEVSTTPPSLAQNPNPLALFP
jgi:hypothetical protein